MFFSGFLVDVQSLVIKEKYCKLKKTFVFVQTSAAVYMKTLRLNKY